MYAALEQLAMECQVSGDVPVTLIEGEAKGADSMSRSIAENELAQSEWQISPYPADWKTYGKAAGAIRNRQMLNAHPDLVLAFHNDIVSSKGTKDMVRIAKLTGIKTIVLRSGERL